MFEHHNEVFRRRQYADFCFIAVGVAYLERIRMLRHGLIYHPVEAELMPTATEGLNLIVHLEADALPVEAVVFVNILLVHLHMQPTLYHLHRP